MTKSSDKVSAKKTSKKRDRLKKKQDGDKFWAKIRTVPLKVGQLERRNGKKICKNFMMYTLRRVLRTVTSIGGGGA